MRLFGILGHHLAVKFLAQPSIDVRRQLHAGRGQGVDRGAEPRQSVDE